MIDPDRKSPNGYGKYFIGRFYIVRGYLAVVCHLLRITFVAHAVMLVFYHGCQQVAFRLNRAGMDSMPFGMPCRRCRATVPARHIDNNWCLGDVNPVHAQCH